MSGTSLPRHRVTVRVPSIGGATKPPPSLTTRAWRYVIRLSAATVAATVAALASAGAATSASVATLHHREHRQVRSLHARLGTIRFFHRHPQLARTTPGQRALRVAHVWIPILRRELAETRAQLPPRAPWPAWWYGQAMCIHRHEGAWNEKSNPDDRGGMQFAWSTWQAFGGHGDPADASPWEQLYRAWLLYSHLGRWGTSAGWPLTSIACGLR